MDRLSELENKSVYLLREAYANFRNLCMLWSIGKDSTVALHLAKKAFFGRVPFPLVHIDTHFKIPEMIAYRDKIAKEYGLYMIYGENSAAIAEKRTFPDGNLTRIECCSTLKTEALAHILDGTWQRYKMDLSSGKYVVDENKTPFEGVIVGVRGDEEGSRSKERYFSPRNASHDWNVEDQPPEIWDQYKTDFRKGTEVRVHPLLDWTEVDIWRYIARENIEVTGLYFDRGDHTRYRSLGCAPCTKPISSFAKTPQEIVEELTNGSLARVAERSGRDQDKEDGGGLETLRREGYM